MFEERLVLQSLLANAARRFSTSSMASSALDASPKRYATTGGSEDSPAIVNDLFCIGPFGCPTTVICGDDQSKLTGRRIHDIRINNFFIGLIPPQQGIALMTQQSSNKPCYV